MEEKTVAQTSAVAAETGLPPELRKPLVPVEGTEKKKMMKVLVAIDESELSFYALQWALDNLFRNSSDVGGGVETLPEAEINQQEPDTVTVIHVMQPYQHYVFPAGPADLFTSLL